MQHTMLHRVTVTQADRDYVDSITIDRTLLDAARLLRGERVAAWGIGLAFNAWAVYFKKLITEDEICTEMGQST